MTSTILPSETYLLLAIDVVLERSEYVATDSGSQLEFYPKASQIKLGLEIYIVSYCKTNFIT